MCIKHHRDATKIIAWAVKKSILKDGFHLSILVSCYVDLTTLFYIFGNCGYIEGYIIQENFNIKAALKNADSIFLNKFYQIII